MFILRLKTTVKLWNSFSFPGPLSQTLSHFQTSTLPFWDTSTLPHFHTSTLPDFHYMTLPHYHTSTLPDFHTAILTTLPHFHTARLPHCQTYQTSTLPILTTLPDLPHFHTTAHCRIIAQSHWYAIFFNIQAVRLQWRTWMLIRFHCDDSFCALLPEEKALCFNCTGPQHGAADCKSKMGCQKCHKRHHTSICNNPPLEKTLLKTAQAESKDTATYPVVIVDVEGIKCRAVLAVRMLLQLYWIESQNDNPRKKQEKLRWCLEQQQEKWNCQQSRSREHRANSPCQ